MGKAAELAQKEMDSRIEKETQVRDYLIQKIREAIPYVKLNGDENAFQTT